MEFQLSSSTIVAAIFSIIVLSFLLLAINRKTSKTRNNRKPPPAKGAWPVIGHLHLLGGPELPHKVLGDMAEAHGPIFTIKLGAHQALVVSDGAIAKDCFSTNDKAFAGRPKSQASKIMGYNYAMFGIAPYGDYWRQMRKMVMQEVLSQRQVEMLGHVRASQITASTKDLYDGWLKNKLSVNSETVKVEMSRWFGNLVVNIICRIISGKSFSSDDEEGVRFQTIIRKFLMK